MWYTSHNGKGRVIFLMEDLKNIIAKNIITLRKSHDWTQAELAEKLNYSDKAVSKWERGESVPDVSVLKKITDLFGVSIDYLVRTGHEDKMDEPKIKIQHRKRNHMVVTLLSATLVFLLTTIVYFVLGLILPDTAPLASWMVYIYGIPVACVVLLVFNSLWGRGKLNYWIISVLVWSILLSVYLTAPLDGMWRIFLIGIPAQIIIFLWANFKWKIR